MRDALYLAKKGNCVSNINIHSRNHTDKFMPLKAK